MTEIVAVGRGSGKKEEKFPGLGGWVTCGTTHGSLKQLG